MQRVLKPCCPQLTWFWSDSYLHHFILWPYSSFCLGVKGKSFLYDAGNSRHSCLLFLSTCEGRCSSWAHSLGLELKLKQSFIWFDINIRVMSFLLLYFEYKSQKLTREMFDTSVGTSSKATGVFLTEMNIRSHHDHIWWLNAAVFLAQALQFRH